jgi:hypothetical protein
MRSPAPPPHDQPAAVSPEAPYVGAFRGTTYTEGRAPPPYLASLMAQGNKLANLAALLAWGAQHEMPASLMAELGSMYAAETRGLDDFEGDAPSADGGEDPALTDEPDEVVEPATRKRPRVPAVVQTALLAASSVGMPLHVAQAPSRPTRPLQGDLESRHRTTVRSPRGVPEPEDERYPQPSRETVIPAVPLKDDNQEAGGANAIETSDESQPVIRNKEVALGQLAVALAEVERQTELASQSALEAKELGATWAEIGQAVGITPHGAYQRWSERGKERHRAAQRKYSGREVDSSKLSSAKKILQDENGRFYTVETDQTERG